MKKTVIRVLLIEDEPTSKDIIEEFLTKINKTHVHKIPEFQLESFDRLAHGIERLEQGNIDIVLLDLNLPDSCGIATLEKAMYHIPDLPVIVITGLDDNDLPIKALQYGAQDYLVKSSFNREMLIRVIRYAIERKRSEQEFETAVNALKHSHQDLEQFAYVASHDLQEPLRVIVNYLQLIEMRYAMKLDDKGKDFITRAVNGSKRMQIKIDDLLEYSRVTTQARQLNPCSFTTILQEALEHLKNAISHSGATITYDPLPDLSADKIQMINVFKNILHNGIKFCAKGEKPCIHVSAKQKGKKWQFSIKDNGIGINSDFHTRIFQIFQRLHTRDEYNGTGAGLAICKKIIERHGGSIWVESELGMGSVFFFTVPVHITSASKYTKTQKEHSLNQ